MQKLKKGQVNCGIAFIFWSQFLVINFKEDTFEKIKFFENVTLI